ncbi:MAG: UbiA family prenyltransferase [Verrucomicrobia bacterium]|nr:UbiA family prenyltransferase [Verrucomicrobiota bacterium]
MSALRAIRNYLELIRFSHTLFALPFALASMLIAAEGVPPWWTVVLILAAMVTARSCAMALNRLVDADLDARNPRTSLRHIPAGRLRRTPVTVFAVACALAFMATTWFLHPGRLPFLLSPVVIAVFVFYPFTKRLTALTHFVLGVALGLAPVGAWIAVLGRFDAAPVLFGAAVVCWVAGFDVIYATMDEAFDREAGLRSLVVALGAARALVIARLLHVATLVLLAVLGRVEPVLGLFWFIGLALIAALLVYEHAIIRRHPTDARRINVAFFHVNAVVSLAVLVFAALDVFTSRG